MTCVLALVCSRQIVAGICGCNYLLGSTRYLLVGLLRGALRFGFAAKQHSIMHVLAWIQAWIQWGVNIVVTHVLSVLHLLRGPSPQAGELLFISGSKQCYTHS
jgi:hypothetical protein